MARAPSGYVADPRFVRSVPEITTTSLTGSLSFGASELDVGLDRSAADMDDSDAMATLGCLTNVVTVGFTDVSGASRALSSRLSGAGQQWK